MQIVLHATHGVVSGEPEFFKRAFGNEFVDYLNLLSMPHDFIFNRDYYEKGAGRGEYYEFQRALPG